MCAGFNPWAIPSEPFHHSTLGALSEGEARYVSLEEIHITPPPLSVMWVSRSASAGHAQTDQRRIAIERTDEVYWVWLSPRECQFVMEAERTQPQFWAVPLQIASEVTRPGARPPADLPRRSQRRPAVTDLRDPASTALQHPYMIVAMGTDGLVDASDCTDASEPAEAGADCGQDAPTVQVDMSSIAMPDSGSGSPSHNEPHTPHISHDPGPSCPPNDGGGWVDGGGGLSCGGGIG